MDFFNCLWHQIWINWIWFLGYLALHLRKISTASSMTRYGVSTLLFDWVCPAPSPPLDNMGIVWRLRVNIIRTALCWIVWHNVHSQQHTHMSSSYRSNRLGSSHWDHYAVRRGGCLEWYYCNMVEWFWLDSSPISTTNWFSSVLWHSWFGRLGHNLACKNCSRLCWVRR